MSKPNVLIVGTGEYTTGYVAGAAAAADKRAGVVALTVFDLRNQGRVGRVLLAGTNGTKFPEIRRHLQARIGDVYRDMDTSFEGFPADEVLRDERAYEAALQSLSKGDAVIVFTPDDKHFEITMAAIERGCHVLIAKPIVKRLAEHMQLRAAAESKGLLVAMEVHKRWDPFYIDARDRIRSLGDFSFFQSYMSQPKSQLETFRNWAGVASDISYYLNAHHVDFHAWCVAAFAKPLRVRAVAASGFALGRKIPAEDTITLIVEWLNHSGNLGTAIYTASWIAPPSDVHSQQRFHYMGHYGEISTDQAHRGYTLATDDHGFASSNPLFMKYAPDSQGRFAGRSGYGYRSIADFMAAVDAIRSDSATAADFNGKLATVHDTQNVTAILEAGRLSLDLAGQVIDLEHDASGHCSRLKPPQLVP